MRSDGQTMPPNHPSPFKPAATRMGRRRPAPAPGPAHTPDRPNTEHVSEVSAKVASRGPGAGRPSKQPPPKAHPHKALRCGLSVLIRNIHRRAPPAGGTPRKKRRSRAHQSCSRKQLHTWQQTGAHPSSARLPLRVARLRPSMPAGRLHIAGNTQFWRQPAQITYRMRTSNRVQRCRKGPPSSVAHCARWASVPRPRPPACAATLRSSTNACRPAA